MPYFSIIIVVPLVKMLSSGVVATISSHSPGVQAYSLSPTIILFSLFVLTASPLGPGRRSLRAAASRWAPAGKTTARRGRSSAHTPPPPPPGGHRSRRSGRSAQPYPGGRLLAAGAQRARASGDSARPPPDGPGLWPAHRGLGKATARRGQPEWSPAGSQWWAPAPG